jgi:hypothetical protein
VCHYVVVRVTVGVTSACDQNNSGRVCDREGIGVKGHVPVGGAVMCVSPSVRPRARASQAAR